MKKSDFYDDYKVARNKAWDTIIKYNISSLPVDMFDLCQRMKIHTASYTQAKKTIITHDLHKYTIENDGFAARINGHYIIFYDDEIVPHTRLRFTLGHEVGHIVIGHLLKESVCCRNSVTLWNKGEGKEPNPLETAANIFASRLLAPACVLRALNIHDAKEIASLCGLSMTASEIRAKRMEALYKRECELLDSHKKSCFGLSINERMVLNQFRDFIHNIKDE